MDVSHALAWALAAGGWVVALWQQTYVKRLTHKLDIAREAAGRVHADKLNAYRLAGDVIANTLAMFTKSAIGRLTAAAAVGDAIVDFERTRLRAYIYLGMVAPREVMTAHDNLTDYFIEIINNPSVYDWKKVRTLGLALINLVRKDIGFDPRPIEYRGPY